MKWVALLLAAFLAGCQTVDRGSFVYFDRSMVNKAHGYQVVDDPTGTAPTPKVERFEVRAGDCGANQTWNDCLNDRERSELKQEGSSEYPGSSAWYGWSIYIPEDYKTLSPTKTNMGQFHQRGSHVVWMFHEANGGYYLDEQTSGRTNNYLQLIHPSELKGKWHRIEVNVGWSRNSDGFFKVWVNGKQKANYSGRTMTANEAIFRYGIYRSFISRYISSHGNPVPTQIVYFSNVRRASTRAGLQRP